jgi:hypothetical protein
MRSLEMDEEGAHDDSHSNPRPLPEPTHDTPLLSDALSLRMPPAPAKQSPLPADHARTTALSGFFTKVPPSPAKYNAASHSQTMEDRLSFFQRHFCRPIDKDPEKSFRADNRRFSFRSPGFIATATFMLLVLLGVVAAAVAVTLDQKAQQNSHHHPPAYVPNGTHPATNATSPIRAAIVANFPDPSIVYDNGTWYAFATNSAAGILAEPANFTGDNVTNIQMATSSDFVHWDPLDSNHDPLPVTGMWVTQGETAKPPQIPRANVWAPALLQRTTDSKYVMYYSANRASKENVSVSMAEPGSGNHPPPHCVGAALSRGLDPAGPYDPLNDTLACPVDQGGAIDPYGFRDADGTNYLFYKVDGNNIGHGGTCGNTKAPIVPTPIMLQKLEADATTASGEPFAVLNLTDSDGPLIEAPAVVRSKEGVYFLFFSSGCTRAPTYDIKYATASSITGPYVRSGKPFLETGDYGMYAPGSVGIHEDGEGGFAMAFHARITVNGGAEVRAMFTTKLKFDGHVAYMVRANATDTGS